MFRSMMALVGAGSAEHEMTRSYFSTMSDSQAFADRWR